MYISVNNITYYFDKDTLKDKKNIEELDYIWHIIINNPKNSYEFNKLKHYLKYYINKKYNDNKYLNNIDKLIFK